MTIKAVLACTCAETLPARHYIKLSIASMQYNIDTIVWRTFPIFVPCYRVLLACMPLYTTIHINCDPSSLSLSPLPYPSSPSFPTLPLCPDPSPPSPPPSPSPLPVAQDQGCLPGLVLFLDDQDEKVVLTSLQALSYLAEEQANCPVMKSEIGLTESLKIISKK